MTVKIKKRTLTSAIALTLILATIFASSAFAQFVFGSISPTSISPGESVTITIELSDGLPLTKYRFDIIVTNPSGASQKNEILFQTDLTGSGSGSTVYPTDFGGANTDESGQYSVTADQTAPINQPGVWSGSFTVSSPTTTTTTLPPPTTTSTTAPQFDFSLSVSPETGSVLQGSNVITSVVVERISGVPQNVTLSAFDNLHRTLIEFSPRSGLPTFTSRMNVFTSNSTESGVHTITVTGIGGGKAHSKSFTLTVKQIVKINVEASAFVDSSLSVSTLNFKRGQTISVKASASYENATKVAIAQATFSLYGRDSHLTFNPQLGFWRGNFLLKFDDPLGNQTASITVVDTEGNTGSAKLSVTLNPSLLIIESFSARDETGFPRLSFGINETLFFFFRVSYENGSYLASGQYSLQVKAPNSYTVVTMIATYDPSRLGFYTNDGYQTSPKDLLGQWSTIIPKDTVDDGNGNSGPSSDFNHSFIVLKPSSISSPELAVSFYSDSSYSTQKSKFLKGDTAYIKVDARYLNDTQVARGSVTVKLGEQFYSLEFDELMNAWVGRIFLNSISQLGPQALEIFLDDGKGAFVRSIALISVEGVNSIQTPWVASISYPAIIIIGSALTAVALLRRKTIGLEYLDHLMGGGIPEASSVVLVGDEGSGKSTLALSLVCRDLKKGKPALILSYDTFPENVLKRMAALDCSQAQDSNSLRIMDCYSGQAGSSASIEPFNLTNLGILVSLELKAMKGARVLVDSAAPLFNAVDHKQVLSFLQALSVKVKQQSGILFVTLASQAVPPETMANLETLADGVIELTTNTEKGRRQRHLTVKKMHERRIIDTPTSFMISKEGRILFRTKKLNSRIPHS